MTTAVVVGSGPNGLAAAVALAKGGVQVTVLEATDEIGGGCSSEAILPDLIHDHCSAFHPMAVGSTFLNSLGLERYGLQWRWPEIDCAHPLDSGDAGVLRRSLDDTAAGLGSDGPRWRSIFGKALSDVRCARRGHHGSAAATAQASACASTVRAAHTAARLDIRQGLPHSVRGHCSVVLPHIRLDRFTTHDIRDRARNHHRRTPSRLAGRGRRLTIDNQRAAISPLGDLGGKIETGARIESASQLPGVDVTMFDVAPGSDRRHPGRTSTRRVTRGSVFSPRSGAFKVDFAVEGGVP